jgi:hypothetical protein
MPALNSPAMPEASVFDVRRAKERCRVTVGRG